MQTACSKKTNTISSKQKIYNYTHPIPFAPKHYVCKKTLDSMTIDGQDTENSWAEADWSEEFVDIEGELKPLPELKTQFKMLWDNDNLYFFFKMEEPHVWAKLKNRDDIIYHDDDIEIFIDPDGDGHNYYELEWNAFNTLWDLILLRPYRTDKKPKVLFNWNVHDIQSATHVEGTINNPSDIDQYWTIEIAIGWSALKEFASPTSIPKDGDQWRINFSRVDWTMTRENNTYTKALDADGNKLAEDNWVWSPTGYINMHMPEQWGYVQFSDKNVNQKNAKFKIHKDEQIKWGLWQMYWQQREYFKDNGKYTNKLNQFTVPTLTDCSFTPKIYSSPNRFEIWHPSCENSGQWIIQENGQIYFKE